MRGQYVRVVAHIQYIHQTPHIYISMSNIIHDVMGYSYSKSRLYRRNRTDTIIRCRCPYLCILSVCCVAGARCLAYAGPHGGPWPPHSHVQSTRPIASVYDDEDEDIGREVEACIGPIVCVCLCALICVSRPPVLIHGNTNAGWLSYVSAACHSHRRGAVCEVRAAAQYDNCSMVCVHGAGCASMCSAIRFILCGSPNGFSLRSTTLQWFER